MKIHLATDHAGFELKNQVSAWLAEELGHEVVDHGAQTFDAMDDYPDFVIPAARAVQASPQREKAIIFGGSGQGEAMAANRFGNVRAAVYYGGELDIVRLSREHNDANVLSLGARFVSFKQAQEAITLWLATEAIAAEKYHRRITKMTDVS